MLSSGCSVGVETGTGTHCWPRKGGDAEIPLDKERIGCVARQIDTEQPKVRAYRSCRFARVIPDAVWTDYAAWRTISATETPLAVLAKGKGI